MQKLALSLILFLFSYLSILAQESPFSYWEEGVWTHSLTIYNGDTIQDQSMYVVEKENDRSFHERWYLDIGEQLLPARVTKAYDRETEQWKMFYSDGTYAQLWEGKLEERALYFYKTFNFSGNTFLSRQKWKKIDDNKVLRTIERSEDRGKTWSTRYYMILEKRN